MQAIEVAVMGPKYQVNLGHIARVSKNFGVERLILVNPRCDYLGKQAIKYSKHARNMLESARILRSLKSIDGCFVVGTTGIAHKTGDSFYNLYSLEKVRRMAIRAASAGKRVVLLLGRDDTGLSKDELRLCDATVFIGASKEYPILNISHALAIMLHAMHTNGKIPKGVYADPAYQKRVLELFARLVDANPRIRDRRSVKMAFRHVLGRAMPTRKEINALSIAFAMPSKAKRKR